MKMAPTKLYHYCSVESMFKILDSKSLWLSNSRQMNDSEESTWIELHFNLINEVFKDIKYTKYLEETFQSYKLNKHKPFIFCLSEKKDSLSQWRAYSADGRGVNIGFSTKVLALSQDPPWPNVNANCTIGLLPIQYSFRKQKNLVENKSKEFKIGFDNKSDELWYASSVFLGISLSTLSMTFKNPSFKEEKEWRIIHTPTTCGYDEISDTEERMSKLKFRTNNDNIVTYHQYDLTPIFSDKLITEINLGPRSHIDIPELELFLKHNNLIKTKITKSKSTYR